MAVTYVGPSLLEQLRARLQRCETEGAALAVLWHFSRDELVLACSDATLRKAGRITTARIDAIRADIAAGRAPAFVAETLSLSDRVDRFVVGKIARRITKECPAMVKLFGWFTDPAHPGRKRGVAVAAFMLSALLKLIDQGMGQACEAALLQGASCTLHVGAYASWVDIGNEAVQTYVVPGADLVGAVMGVWGLIHGKTRQPVAAIATPAGPVYVGPVVSRR